MTSAATTTSTSIGMPTSAAEKAVKKRAARKRVRLAVRPRKKLRNGSAATLSDVASTSRLEVAKRRRRRASQAVTRASLAPRTSGSVAARPKDGPSSSVSQAALTVGCDTVRPSMRAPAAARTRPPRAKTSPVTSAVGARSTSPPRTMTSPSTRPLIRASPSSAATSARARPWTSRSRPIATISWRAMAPSVSTSAGRSSAWRCRLRRCRCPQHRPGAAASGSTASVSGTASLSNTAGLSNTAS